MWVRARVRVCVSVGVCVCFGVHEVWEGVEGHRVCARVCVPIDLMCLDDCLSESSWIDLERGVLAPGAGVSTVEPGVGVSTVEPGAGVSTVYECDQYQLG